MSFSHSMVAAFRLLIVDKITSLAPGAELRDDPADGLLRADLAGGHGRQHPRHLRGHRLQVSCGWWRAGHVTTALLSDWFLVMVINNILLRA